jgi:hypothetical protein
MTKDVSCKFKTKWNLRRADHSSKEPYRLCKKDYETEEEARVQESAVESLKNEMNSNLLIPNVDTRAVHHVTDFSAEFWTKAKQDFLSSDSS